MTEKEMLQFYEKCKNYLKKHDEDDAAYISMLNRITSWQKNTFLQSTDLNTVIKRVFTDNTETEEDVSTITQILKLSVSATFKVCVEGSVKLHESKDLYTVIKDDLEQAFSTAIVGDVLDTIESC